jgi:hypothetical protein
MNELQRSKRLMEEILARANRIQVVSGVMTIHAQCRGLIHASMHHHVARGGGATWW